MSEDPEDEFKFEIEDDEDLELEVQDDTPEEDRGKTPMPQELVEELEADELEDYSDKVKTRLKQMKKVWHDERREKERAMREQHEAISLARQAIEENKRLKQTLYRGEETLVGSYKNTAELEAESARKAYKDAYESGDSDKVLEAQERLSTANYRLEQLRNYRPTLQPELPVVQEQQDSVYTPNLDRKTVAWQERNTWYGADPEMTASALGLHQKLEKQYGASYVGTDEYWSTVDSTMRRRFPENFGESEKPNNGSTKPARTGTRAATVVASASRSTASKKIVLKQSQISIAKRLGITPEQYAREFAKTEM
jgi:hypothetical protein